MNQSSKHRTCLYVIVSAFLIGTIGICFANPTAGMASSSTRELANVPPGNVAIGMPLDEPMHRVSSDEQAAKDVADKVLLMWDAGQYKQMYEWVRSETRHKYTEDQWVSFCSHLHAGLGSNVGRTYEGAVSGAGGFVFKWSARYQGYGHAVNEIVAIAAEDGYWKIDSFGVVDPNQ